MDFSDTTYLISEHRRIRREEHTFKDATRRKDVKRLVKCRKRVSVPPDDQ